MTEEHKPGCDALGGYGHGIGPCSCGAAPSQPEGAEDEQPPTREQHEEVLEKLSAVIAYATGDKLSQPGWALATIKAAIDEHFSDHPSQSAGAAAPDEGEARDAALYRWLRSYPDAVRMLVMHFGFGYSRVQGAAMNGPGYLDEVLNEVIECGQDAWGRKIHVALSAPKGEAATPSSQGGQHG